MKIRPMNDYVIVTRKEAETKLPSGLYIPPTAQDKPTEGTVIAVGPGKVLEDGTRRRPEVEAGCDILFAKWGGNEIEVDGTKYLFMREDDILAILAPKS